MAQGKTFIPTKVEIGSAGFVEGTGTIFELIDNEGLEFTIEGDMITIGDGQEVHNALNVGLQFASLDLAIINNASVMSGTTIPATKSKVIFSGNTGSAKVELDEVYLPAKYDIRAGKLPRVMISAKRMATDQGFSIS